MPVRRATMHEEGSQLVLSPTDLGKHLGCRHATTLDRAVAAGTLQAPVRNDPTLEALRERGFRHEEQYLAELRARGLSIVDLRSVDGAPRGDRASAMRALARTREALASGADVIVQADLRDGDLGGRADFLLRVATPSALGAWSYEVVDTKLAQTTRASTLLQLCAYGDLLERLQGVAPAAMHVVKPGVPCVRETYRCADFAAYYRAVRERLAAFVAGEPADTYPDPVPACDTCRWWAPCDARRRADDHLCLVAGAGTVQIRELQRQGIATLAGLGDAEAPLREMPERGAPATYERLHAQARIQLRGRRAGLALHELLPLEPERGLHRLPAPSPGDVFFDIEGDPFVDGGGLEYLLGFATRGRDEALEYQALWARDRIEEKRAFERFVDAVSERAARYPDMHVYHFAPYEPAAIKRLVCRHATREHEVDFLLRGERFVDLHRITRQAVRASVERYTLKDLERCFGFRRAVELRAASRSLRRVEAALELGSRDEIDERDAGAVEGYNRDDCLATAALRDWLEGRRDEHERAGREVARPALRDGTPSDKVAERSAEVQEVVDALLAGLPESRASWSDAERGRWLLAMLLDYFPRETKCAWWEFFRLRELDDEDLLDEREAIAGLEFVGRVGGTDRCPVHAYRFPPQDVDARGRKLFTTGADSVQVGTIETIDLDAHTIAIKKQQKSKDLHPSAVIVENIVSTDLLQGSLLDLGRVLAFGIEALTEEGHAVPTRAALDLLLRLPPRRRGKAPLQATGESTLDAARRVAAELAGGVLPIQGPPGSGKTHTGAHTIVALAKAGKRIGVTAVSHKVIRNLLAKAVVTAQHDRVPLRAVHCTNPGDEPAADGVEELDNKAALEAIGPGTVVGGTAWLWARGEAIGRLDHLFVDEAGQLALAATLAVARAATNLVLLGDPQQLEQPRRGAHPEGADVAALVHVLGDRATMPAERGLFLDETWRLHPSLCAFTSELFYEGRLRARAGLERQALLGDGPWRGAGPCWVPVEHTGNTHRSPDEVAVVQRLVADLLAHARWRDQHGDERALTHADILVVAPYNAQVTALRTALPELRVGTVDRFQGQEAPVVVYSLAASSVDEAPRGMPFLLDAHRFNVATSRARAACLVVGSPALLAPDCRAPDQMRLANALCRFVELARVIAP